MSPVERVYEHLEQRDCRPRGNAERGWDACCPAHPDRNPSLHLGVGEDGRALLTCHAGCSLDQIAAALGLTVTDLFPEGDRDDGRRNDSRNGRREPTAIYAYRDEGGEPLYEVGRFVPGFNGKRKSFAQRPPGREGWKGGIGNAKRVLYQLPEVIAAVKAGKPIYVPEGEADVHALEGADAVATCNPGGAGKWRPEYSEFLRGADVTIVADRDDTGRRHAEAVRASLDGVAGSVRVVEAAEGNDARDHLAAGHTLDEFVPVGQGSEEPAPVSAPALALGAARVDLVALIANGIPERAFLPGCEPWFIAGKRYLMPAAAGTGKSIAALIIAVTIIENGGTVVILDVENGSDEYARRLADILDDRKPQVTTACQERLGYYEWPMLSITWTASEWADAVAGADLVVFDSSRLTLSSVGLAEDKADDYSVFVDRFLLPLAKAGISTLVLDNTGHEQQDRSRGTSAKGDLNEVSYALKVGAPFDWDRAGHLRLVRVRQRFAGLARELRIPLGGGSYGAPEAVEADGDTSHVAFRPTVLMERASRLIEEKPGLSKRAIRTSVKGAKNDFKDLAVDLLVDEGYVEDRGPGQAHKYHPIRPYREADDPLCPTVPQPCPGTVKDDRARVPPPKGHGARLTGRRGIPTVPQFARRSSPTLRRARTSPPNPPRTAPSPTSLCAGRAGSRDPPRTPPTGHRPSRPARRWRPGGRRRPRRRVGEDGVHLGAEGGPDALRGCNRPMRLRGVRRGRTLRALQALPGVAAMSDSVTPPALLLDTEGAAEYLNLPKSWVAAEVRAGRMPHVRFGRYVRFDPNDLRAYVEEHRQGG
jgi:excisionase family DNA binding protein